MGLNVAAVDCLIGIGWGLIVVGSYEKLESSCCRHTAEVELLDSGLQRTLT